MSEGLKKRHVFYIAGYDPRGARYYYNLYKKQASRQSLVNGLPLQVGPRARVADIVQRWHIQCGDVETIYDFLSWDDIVRREWRGGIGGWWRDMRHFYGARVLRQVVLPICRAIPTRYMSGFYSLAYQLLLTLISVASGAAIHVLLGGGVIGWLSGLALSTIIFYGGIRLARRLAVFWLLKILGFTARWGGGYVEGMAQRADIFAAHIVNVMQDESVDEILIVGHSVGSILSVPVVSRVLKNMDAQEKRVNLMTLAQSIPLVSFQNKAHVFHEELASISSDPRLFWVDFSAPPDGACFPLSLVVPERDGGPKGFSPRFFQLYDKERYKTLRRDFYTFHFLYLHATERNGLYDYYALTGGPQSMRMRLANAGVLS